VQHDVVQIAELEQAVPANCGILRCDRFERSSSEIAREDDVYDVLRREALLRGDRIDDRDGTF